MSNVGLNSSIYHTTRNYLDLLNHFLVDLNYAQEMGKSFDHTAIVDFLNKLNSKNNLDPTLRLIRSMFYAYYRENRRDPEKGLQELVQKLQKEKIETTEISDLESFIDMLKYQCDESYSRLKGKE